MVFVFLFRIKMKQIICCFLILSGFLTSCRSVNKVFPYYYSEDFALFKLNHCNDSINGSIFWINRKDSTQLKGMIQDGIFEFSSYMNGVDERYFSYKGYIKNNQIIVVRDAKFMDRRDTIVLTSVSQAKYDSILYATPKLEVLRRDTVIDNYKFELLVEDWDPETHFGNTTFTIKEKESNKVLQIIASKDFHFNKNLDFGYTDMNFDNIKDLIFFNGFNGGYGTQTFDYYLYNAKHEKFLLNEQLAEIAGGMGIDVDTVKKRIVSYEKSGCCWHEQKAFVAEGDIFIEVKCLTVDEMSDSGTNVTVRSKVNGKWETQEIHLKELTEQLADSLYKSF